MSLPFSINSARDWITHVPTFLASLSEYSDFVRNASVTSYLANTLAQVMNEAKEEILLTIYSILNESSDVGKFVLIQTLLHATDIWTDLVQFSRIKPTLTALALSPDKLYTKDAINLSQKLEDIPSSEITRDIEDDSTIYKAEEKEMAKQAPEMVREDSYGAVRTEKKKAKRSMPVPSSTQEIPTPVPQPVPKPAPPPAAPARGVEPSPPPPSVSIGAKAAESTKSRLAEKGVFDEAEEELEPLLEEPAPVEEAFDDQIIDDFKPNEAVMAGSADVGSPRPTPQSKSVFTHVHYFNRMNSRKTYPFTVSLSSAAKKVRARKMHILSGERETEKQAEFELDHLTRQIMVELLISGCLVQPNFQYVDPDNLPVELTFYITPLVEAGYQASKIEGQLLLKNDMGMILQNLPLSDIFVVSNRISKIAALVGAIGGGTLPALDFLFGVNLQEALTGQLEYTAPDIANEVNIRSLITTSQIAIFVIFISIGLLWWWRKGRSRRAPEEKLAINLPQ